MMLSNRLNKIFIELFIFAFVVAAIFGVANAGTVTRLVGTISVEALATSITLAAADTPSGIHGEVNMQGGLRGPVVEIIPPSNSLDSWCINVALSNPGLEGLNMLVYVRNVGDGKTSFDEVSFGGGPGATCADFSVATDPFFTASSGDFKASI